MKKKSFVRKNITITKTQGEFVVKAHLNLSRFVQEKLEEVMKDG